MVRILDRHIRIGDVAARSVTVHLIGGRRDGRVVGIFDIAAKAEVVTRGVVVVPVMPIRVRLDVVTISLDISQVLPQIAPIVPQISHVFAEVTAISLDVLPVRSDILPVQLNLLGTCAGFDIPVQLLLVSQQVSTILLQVLSVLHDVTAISLDVSPVLPNILHISL